jgi:sugar/nucleoside kinase (ribokinase family)
VPEPPGDPRGRVLVVGSIALDTVETPSGRRENVLGGAAVYASFAASFFSPVCAVGVVGRDFPIQHLQQLQGRGIDTSGIEVKDGSTFRWSGRYEGDMNSAETLSTHLNVFADFLPHLSDSLRSAEHVFLANIDPDLQLSVLSQVEGPRIAACDTMNFWIDGKPDALREVLTRVDVVLVNDAEARQLTGLPSLSAAAHAILGLGPRCVVVKKGEHGAYLVTSDSAYIVPPYPLETVVDPTGAGDSFAGAFVGYLASSCDVGTRELKRAALRGSAVASFAVEGFSLGRLQELTIGEIESRVVELIDLSTI